jgi:tetratricopeptide (TPR) repeat protein
MKQYCFICIFLCACFLSSAQIDREADSLFYGGDFINAAVAFEYLAFQEMDKSLKGVLLLKKSYCYKARGEYDQALAILKRVRPAVNDTLKEIVSYEKILLGFLSDDYQSSYNDLLKHKLVFGKIDSDLFSLEVLNLMALNRWEEAKILIQQNSDLLDFSSEEIEYIFTKKLKPKNPDKAFNLSMFLPGVGQMYTGYFFKGVVSGGAQALLIGFSAFSLYNGYFFTGGMTGVALFYTFYFGGARYARELAIQKNKKRALEMSLKFNDLKLKKAL